MEAFLATGEVGDRGLEGGIRQSGWSAAEIRAGMTKTYNVSLVGVERYLSSQAGIRFLENATNSYFPYWTLRTYAVQALRSAVVLDAVDGVISAIGILRNLPTDFRLADFCNTYSGAQNICAEGRCQPGTAQCSSLLSWYVFLPACIQANQLPEPLALQPGGIAPAPVALPAPPVRGLW